MAFATASGSQMSEMNVTPLVDVMLVLLIIFMVTVPAIDYANDVDFTRSPQGKAAPLAPLKVHISAGDTLSLDGQPVTLQQLQARFAVEAAKGMVAGKFDAQRQPELNLYVEPDAEYSMVTQVMSRAKNENLVRVGFAD
jgi:biopolymer transport protein ExbD